MRNGWIAALVVVGWGGLAHAFDETAPVKNTVKLDLQLSGLGSAGCKVDIRPAHLGCRFEPIVREYEQVPTSGVLRVETLTIEASALNADRNCAFAITVIEPSGKPRVFKRIVRLSTPTADEPTPVVSQTFYLRTTTLAKREKR